MRVPISWLRDFVTFDLSTVELAERLTVAGIEVSGHERIGVFSEQVVVAAIVEAHPCPGDENLQVMTLDIGDRQISAVTGAPDLARAKLGTRVPVALPGATVLGSKTAFELLPVKIATIRGFRSEGVVLSANELGVGAGHSGALILDSKANLGQPVFSYFEMDADWVADEVIVIEILANIARCQSIRGVAREVAAIANGTYHPEVDVRKIEVFKQPLSQGNFDGNLCHRFSEVVVDGVEVKSSPAWMQRRLILAGLDPINNVVDAANYVMLELGQPMHTYDADKVPALPLGVRRAREGEMLRTLLQDRDADPQALIPGVPVVISGDRPVAVAGVVGGAQTAVSQNTRRLVIESANFDFLSCRRAQAATKASTEASSRFSRGVNPAMTLHGIERLLSLLAETASGVSVSAARDWSAGAEDQITEIEVDVAAANAALGTNFTIHGMRRELSRVGIQSVANSDRGVIVATVTTEREDIALPCDLIEEVVRLYGYDHVPQTMPLQPVPIHPRNDHLHMRERARDAMVRAGLQEIVTYSLTSPEVERRLTVGAAEGSEAPPYVAVVNPISSERTVMRRSLLPELLLCMQRNLRHVDDCHLFELGQVFLDQCPSDSSLLPREQWRLAIAMTGGLTDGSVHNRGVPAADFFDIAEVVNILFRHLHIDGMELEADQCAPFHPGVCAKARRGATVYGHLGELHPLVAREFNLVGHRVVCAYLSLDAIVRDSVRFFATHDLPTQPSIKTDISLSVPEEVPAAELRKIVTDSAGCYLVHVDVFDVYVGQGIPAGRKAVGLRLTLNAGDRTLKMSEEREVFSRVVEQLTSEVGAEVRA